MCVGGRKAYHSNANFRIDFMTTIFCAIIKPITIDLLASAFLLFQLFFYFSFSFAAAAKYVSPPFFAAKS